MYQMFERRFDELKSIVSFTQKVFESQDIDPSLRQSVDLAVEELFVNMVTYNLETTSQIKIQMDALENGVEVSLTDYDVERFDPTKVPPVDINAPLEERTSRGLGLYLVIKMVDSIHYEYQNRQSKITFTKKAG